MLEAGTYELDADRADKRRLAAEVAKMRAKAEAEARRIAEERRLAEDAVWELRWWRRPRESTVQHG